MKIKTLGNSQNPPIVFLHGFMGTGTDWTEIASRFSDRFYCLLPDLPGHGETPLSDEISYATWASLINEELSAHGIKKTHLVGYSMGGRLALYFALTYPEMVEKLVLESANPGIEDEVERTERAALDDKLAARLHGEGMSAFLEFWYNIPLFASLNETPALKAELIHKRAHQNPENMARVLSELSPGRQPSLWARLSELTMPTLLVAGELDEKYCRITSQMEATLPKPVLSRVEASTRVTLPGCGHDAHLEVPALFRDYLAAWLICYSK